MSRKVFPLENMLHAPYALAMMKTLRRDDDKDGDTDSITLFFNQKEISAAAAAAEPGPSFPFFTNNCSFFLPVLLFLSVRLSCLEDGRKKNYRMLTTDTVVLIIGCLTQSTHNVHTEEVNHWT